MVDSLEILADSYHKLVHNFGMQTRDKRRLENFESRVSNLDKKFAIGRFVEIKMSKKCLIQAIGWEGDFMKG